MDFSDWSPRDFALLGTALAATYADDQSTKEMLKRGGNETHPILGSKPKGADVDAEMLTSAGLAAVAAHAIPEKYRGAFLGGWTGLETGYAANNAGVSKSSPKATANQTFTKAALPAALGAVAGYLLPSDSGVGPGELHGTPTIAYTTHFAHGGHVGGFRPRRSA